MGSVTPEGAAADRAGGADAIVRADVDVVVVSWNTRDDLLACLASVTASTGVAVHVVVVDNDSADGSADAVADRFPTVTLVRNAENQGFARAVNRGMRAGSAPFVLLLNPDATVPPDAVAALVGRLRSLPAHALVAPRLVEESGRAQHSAYPFPSLGISVLLALGLQRLLPRRARAHLLLEGAWGSDVERDVPWVIGAALLVRRSAIERVGGLDERFFMYVEDLEFCDRLRRAGYGIRFTPAVTVVHHGNRSGAQRYGEDRTAAWLRNTVEFVRRRHGRAWAAAFVAVNGAATTARWAISGVTLRLRPGGARAARHRLWRSHARYYLGRARRVDPVAAEPGHPGV